jgi:hypothetical protein
VPINVAHFLRARAAPELHLVLQLEPLMQPLVSFTWIVSRVRIRAGTAPELHLVTKMHPFLHLLCTRFASSLSPKFLRMHLIFGAM